MNIKRPPPLPLQIHLDLMTLQNVPHLPLSSILALSRCRKQRGRSGSTRNRQVPLRKIALHRKLAATNRRSKPSTAGTVPAPGCPLWPSMGRHGASRIEWEANFAPEPPNGAATGRFVSYVRLGPKKPTHTHPLGEEFCTARPAARPKDEPRTSCSPHARLIHPFLYSIPLPHKVEKSNITMPRLLRSLAGHKFQPTAPSPRSANRNDDTDVASCPLVAPPTAEEFLWESRATPVGDPLESRSTEDSAEEVVLFPNSVGRRANPLRMLQFTG